MSTYAAREARIRSAIALKEADRVPLIPVMQCFPIYHAGYSMKDVLYDYDKGAEAYIKYALDYQPDAVMGHSWLNMGKGPIYELQEPKTMTWAGAPSGEISDDSIHQWKEFPILEDEYMEMFATDRTGWALSRGLPNCYKLLEPFANVGWQGMSGGMDMSNVAAAFSTPEMKELIQKCWKITELNQELAPKGPALDKKLEELGFPVLHQGFAGVPFDSYSDFYRGTINGMIDLYEYEEIVQDFRARSMNSMIPMIQMQGKMIPGKFVFMALHKGMDGFMSDEQYRKYYWSDLQVIIEEIIKNGMVPYIYTEGDYDSRLECLKEVTPGKVVYHFENCDMARAKKVLGDTACISGGFNMFKLEYGSNQDVADECKRLIDACAPGGGFIFETAYGVDHVQPGNMETLFETVKEYGKY